MEIFSWKDMLYPYEQVVDELIIKFNSLIYQYKKLGQYSPIESVTGRVKKPSSILDKISKKNVTKERIEKEVEDIAGIRIVCQFVEDIEKVVKLIRERSDMKIVEERDYITNTKPSGYRSYHIIIKYPLNTVKGYKEVSAEIQIRTLSMNFWATTEHSLKYKYSGNIPESVQKRLIYCAEAAFNLDQEMGTIREEIMNAQKLNEIKSNLIANILANIQNLHFKAEFLEIEKLNREFIDIWETEDISKLEDLNARLNTLAELYRV